MPSRFDDAHHRRRSSPRLASLVRHPPGVAATVTFDVLGGIVLVAKDLPPAVDQPLPDGGVLRWFGRLTTSWFGRLSPQAARRTGGSCNHNSRSSLA